MPEIKIVTEVAGRVCALAVEIGGSIGDGDEIAFVEAMKMEIPVTSTTAGKIKAILVKLDDVDRRRTSRRDHRRLNRAIILLMRDNLSGVVNWHTCGLARPCRRCHRANRDDMIPLNKKFRLTKQMGGNMNRRLMNFAPVLRWQASHSWHPHRRVADDVKLPPTMAVTAYDTGTAGFNIAVGVGKMMKDKYSAPTFACCPPATTWRGWRRCGPSAR